MEGFAAIETLLGFYAADVVCYPAPGWVDYPICHGHEGMRDLGARWLELVDHPNVNVHEVRDLRHRLLVLAEFTGRAKDTGTPVSVHFGVVNSDLRDDGKVGEARFFLSWDEARSAAGLATSSVA
jgi:hypothetical protein